MLPFNNQMRVQRMTCCVASIVESNILLVKIQCDSHNCVLSQGGQLYIVAKGVVCPNASAEAVRGN